MADPEPDDDRDRERAERELILRTLKRTGGNKTRAAEILDISLKTLHNKLHRYHG